MTAAGIGAETLDLYFRQLRVVMTQPGKAVAALPMFIGTGTE